MLMTRLHGRPAALVFGGSRGIGAAAVTRLLADGYAVAFTFVSRPDKAPEIVQHAQGEGQEVLASQADSADPAAMKSAVDEAGEGVGGLSVVVVDEGILRLGLIDAVSLD